MTTETKRKGHLDRWVDGEPVRPERMQAKTQDIRWLREQDFLDSLDTQRKFERGEVRL